MKNKKIMRSFATLVGSGAVALAASRASAVTLFDSGGFEAGAGYTAGDYLYNEPTPSTAGGPTTGQFDGGPYTNSDGSSASVFAAVYNYDQIFSVNTNASNQQLVDMETTNNSSTGAYYPLLNTITPTVAAGTSTIAIQFEEAIGDIGSGGSAFGGIVAYGNSANDTPSVPIGELGLDPVSGALIGVSGSSFVATPDTFYDFELLLDYTTGTYSILEAPLGGSYTVLGTNDFLTTGATTFNTAALESFLISGDSASGDVYIDNFIVTAVPEPATASLVMAAVVMGTTVRRRSARSRVGA